MHDITKIGGIFVWGLYPHKIRSVQNFHGSETTIFQYPLLNFIEIGSYMRVLWPIYPKSEEHIAISKSEPICTKFNSDRSWWKKLACAKFYRDRIIIATCTLRTSCMDSQPACQPAGRTSLVRLRK